MTAVNAISLPPRASTSTADRQLRNELQEKFVRELWFLLASVSLLLVVIRLSRLLLHHIFARSPVPPRISEKSDVEGASHQASGGKTRLNAFSAVATSFRIVAFRMTLPIGPQSRTTAAELAFVLGYAIAIFIWLLIDTRNLQVAFWQDRAGHFAACQVCLIVALAGKNNIISFLTGIGHEKLNVLHRASARTCLLLAWIHALGRITSGLPPQFDLTHHWVRAGAVALTALTLATFLSLRPIRQLAYEFFLVSHIVLITIFLFCAWFHAAEQGFGVYLWPAMVIWASDRCVRLARTVWNTRSSQRLSSNATVEPLTADTVRLTLRCQLQWTPGQHAYLMIPSVSHIPTEAHPFTIASVPTRIPGSPDREVVFLIRERGGFTRQLNEYARSQASSSLPVYIDGPYGNPPNLHKYHTCILIAGGSGISYTLAQLNALIRNYKDDKSSVRRLVFLWTVRDGGHLNWISKVLNEALSSAPAALSIEPRVYVTGPNYSIPKMAAGNRPSLDSPTAELNELPLYTSLKLMHGRPSIKKLLHDEISSALGPVSIDVAGPSALTEAIRKSLWHNPASPFAALRGSPTVTLHVETFGMVSG